MSGGALSSRVKNMKFMQAAGDKHRKEVIDTAEKNETKKLKDLSEWSLPVNKRTLKVIKSRKRKIKRVGYSTINSMGPVNSVSTLNGSSGRINTNITTETKKDETDNKTDNAVLESNEPVKEKSEKKTKSKKAKKSKKKSIMDEFKTKNDDEFDPTEVDLTSKSLLDLWRANKK